jgi:hypothetical protein
MKAGFADTIDRIRSQSLFVREESPNLIFRLEVTEKIGPQDPGFLALLSKIYRALKLNRQAKESDVVDLWALDLWEYNRREYEYFSQHPEEFAGFSECGIARVLSHVAITLDFGGPNYLFAMFNVGDQTADLKSEIARQDYEVFLESLPF